MWQIFSIITLVVFSGAFLLFKYASNHGASALQIMLYFFGGAFLCFVVHAGINQTTPVLSPRVAMALAFSAVLGYAGNYCQTLAVTMAPNPGYALAVISAQAITVSLVAAFLFGSEFSAQKGIGMVFCFAGVVLLSLEK